MQRALPARGKVVAVYIRVVRLGCDRSLGAITYTFENPSRIE